MHPILRRLPRFSSHNHVCNLTRTSARFRAAVRETNGLLGGTGYSARKSAPSGLGTDHSLDPYESRHSRAAGIAWSG